ncbi:transposase [Mucilaginibacter oryzae]|uniref:transposase n=1 Tax=Mucilaginibacter oryzae TaxID=468058 RepID=UPI000D6DA89C
MTRTYNVLTFRICRKASLIDDTWAERLRNFIIAIAQNHGHKIIAINNMPDHIHMFVGVKYQSGNF